MRAPLFSSGDRSNTVVVVSDDGAETVVGRVTTCPRDLALVDALMRLQLKARRRGATVRLLDPSDDLRGLLELVGLAGVLGLEPARQAELREQVGVEEVVQPHDPPLG